MQAEAERDRLWQWARLSTGEMRLSDSDHGVQWRLRRYHPRCRQLRRVWHHLSGGGHVPQWRMRDDVQRPVATRQLFWGKLRRLDLPGHDLWHL